MSRKLSTLRIRIVESPWLLPPWGANTTQNTFRGSLIHCRRLAAAFRAYLLSISWIWHSIWCLMSAHVKLSFTAVVKQQLYMCTLLQKWHSQDEWVSVFFFVRVHFWMCCRFPLALNPSTVGGKANRNPFPLCLWFGLEVSATHSVACSHPSLLIGWVF